MASRYVRDIFLIDGTKTSGVASPDESRPEQCVIPKVVMFYDRVASGTEDPPIVKDMVENAGKDTPYHFFGLQARTAQKGGHVISTLRTWYKIEKAQGVKAKELSEKAEQLLQMARSGESITLQTEWSPDNDQTAYEGPAMRHSVVILLNSLKSSASPHSMIK